MNERKLSWQLMSALALFFASGVLHPAHAADCTNPSRPEGAIVYNSDYHTMVFCNGTTWISMAASGGLTEVDPKIGALTANDYCLADGSGAHVVCSTAKIPLTGLNTSGTASGTTYLRGDGVWTVPPASPPSGAAGSVQFSDGANFASDSAFQWDATNHKLVVGGDSYANNFFQNSDMRLKANIRTAAGLAVIERMRGVTFNWKKDGTPSAGILAQDVEKVLPEAVATKANGYKAVSYDALFAPMIEAVKELSAENKALRAEFEAYKAAHP